ncbi:hypothetical protein GCM10027613_30510 [Microlunatus endophyticus]
MRAKPGVYATPRAMTMLQRPVPMVAIRISAIRRTGRASSMSTIRITTVEIHRGAMPPMVPTVTPARLANSTPSRLAVSTGRAPKITRA